MVVKGFQLPAAFVSLVDEGGLTPDHWEDRDLVDAYGNRWDGELEVHLGRSDIEWANKHVEEYFAGDPNDPPPGPPEHCPGFIPYINDFSEIVCFGQGHEGNPYCFDFRENPDRPSISYWDDVYWRRVAPDFETLLALYEPEGQDLPAGEPGGPSLGDTREGEGGTGSTGTTGPLNKAPDLPAWEGVRLIPEPARTEAFGRLKEAMRTMYGRDLAQWMKAELRRLDAEHGNQDD